MSINIRTNIGPAMGGLTEHGTFRNSMYQQQQEKKEKQKTPVRPECCERSRFRSFHDK